MECVHLRIPIPSHSAYAQLRIPSMSQPVNWAKPYQTQAAELHWLCSLSPFANIYEAWENKTAKSLVVGAAPIHALNYFFFCSNIITSIHLSSTTADGDDRVGTAGSRPEQKKKKILYTVNNQGHHSLFVVLVERSEQQGWRKNVDGCGKFAAPLRCRIIVVGFAVLWMLYLFVGDMNLCDCLRWPTQQ